MFKFGIIDFFFVIDFFRGFVSFIYYYIIIYNFGGFVYCLRVLIGAFYYIIFFLFLVCMVLFKYVDIVLKIKINDRKYIYNEFILERVAILKNRRFWPFFFELFYGFKAIRKKV